MESHTLCRRLAPPSWPAWSPCSFPWRQRRQDTRASLRRRNATQNAMWCVSLRRAGAIVASLRSSTRTLGCYGTMFVQSAAGEDGVTAGGATGASSASCVRGPQPVGCSCSCHIARFRTIVSVCTGYAFSGLNSATMRLERGQPSLIWLSAPRGRVKGIKAERDVPIAPVCAAANAQSSL